MQSLSINYRPENVPVLFSSYPKSLHPKIHSSSS